MANKLSLEMILDAFNEAIDELPVFGDEGSNALASEDLSMTSSLLSDMEAIVSATDLRDSALNKKRNANTREIKKIQKDLSDSDKHMIDSFIKKIIMTRGTETLRTIAKSPVSLNNLRNKLIDVLYRKTEHSLDADEKQYLYVTWNYTVTVIKELAFCTEGERVKALRHIA